MAVYHGIGGSFVSHIANAEIAERCWCTIHFDTGPLLLGAWYKAWDQAIDDDFEKEMQKYGEGMVGISMVGDLNAHHQEWLNCSSCLLTDVPVCKEVQNP